MSNLFISPEDRQKLRFLASKQLDISQTPTMNAIVNDWINHGSFSSNSRPMIRIELDTFANEIIPPLLECKGDYARQIESRLYSNFVNHTMFGDDTVVTPYYELRYFTGFIPFGIVPKKEYVKSEDPDTNSLGHHFVPQITDLEKDFPKLGKSIFSILKRETLDEKQRLEDIFGDILPVKFSGGTQVSSLTQDIVHIMSMENMFTSMYDYPELFHAMMNNLTNDYLEFFNCLEKESIFTNTTGSQWLGQGTYCFTNELPQSKEHFSTQDIWIYMDSQETVGVSPEMFDEFIFPYFLKIADNFGLLSYGCCEPVDPFFDKSLSRFKNLKKLSISPWCDEFSIAEKIRDKKIVYLRKPSPNYLGVGQNLDEDAIRRHISKTIDAAKDCHLELIQRDVYTVNKSPEKVRHYVDIIRECINQ